MNVKVLQWLLAHRDLLLQIVNEVGAWKKGSSLTDQWAVIDKVAKLLIPVIDAESVTPKMLLTVDTIDVIALADEDSATKAGILGIDWALLADVIIPLVVAILKALGPK